MPAPLQSSFWFNNPSSHLLPSPTVWVSMGQEGGQDGTIELFMPALFHIIIYISFTQPSPLQHFGLRHLELGRRDRWLRAQGSGHVRVTVVCCFWGKGSCRCDSSPWRSSSDCHGSTADQCQATDSRCAAHYFGWKGGSWYFDFDRWGCQSSFLETCYVLLMFLLNIIWYFKKMFNLFLVWDCSNSF